MTDTSYNTLKINGFSSITIPKYAIPGWGYSNNSGPPIGFGLGPSGDVKDNITQFFNYDVKGLLPASFGSVKKVKKHKKKSSKKSKFGKRRSKKTAQKKRMSKRR